MAKEMGYWNGLPTPIRKIVGTVKEWEEGDPPHAWWRDLCGQEVRAIEVVLDGVNYGGGVTYLYDEDGSGYYKVTRGNGSPRLGHKEIRLINIKEQEVNEKNN